MITILPLIASDETPRVSCAERASTHSLHSFRGRTAFQTAITSICLALNVLPVLAGKQSPALCDDYTPSQEAKALYQDAKTRYGIHPCRYNGFVQDAANPAHKGRFDLFKGKLVSTNLDAAYTLTIAAGEGLAAYWDPETRKNYKHDGTGLPAGFAICGFDWLGVDWFYADVKDLRDAKFLPDDFKEGTHYKLDEHTNELGGKVQSAVFRSLGDGVIALRAELRLANRRMLKDAADSRLALDADQEAFWTYAYFSMGPSKAKAIMVDKKADFQKWPASAALHSKRIRQRMGAWKILQKLSLFAAPN